MSDIDRDGSLDADEFAVVSITLSLSLAYTFLPSIFSLGYEVHHSHQARRGPPSPVTNLNGPTS